MKQKKFSPTYTRVVNDLNEAFKIESQNRPSSLADAIEEYVSTLNSSEIKNFYSSIFKYTLPGLPEIKAPSTRMTELEKLHLIECCSQLPFECIFSLLATQQSYFQAIKLPKSKQYSYISRLKKFVEFFKADGENRRSPDASLFKNNYYARCIKTTKRSKVTGYTLSKYSDEIENLLIEYEAYLVNHTEQSSEKTRDYSIKNIKKMIGLYVKERKIDGAKMKVNDFIPVVDLQTHLIKTKDTDLLTKYAVRKLQAEHECIEASKVICSWLEQSFRVRKLRASSAKEDIRVVTNFTKFLYREHTNAYLHRDFQDVPIVVMLRSLSSKYGKKAVEERKLGKNQNTEGKLVKWAQVKDLTEKSRQKYEALVYSDNKSKIPTATRAKHLARYLMLSFFVYMPPDRQRTVRELTLGKTLKYGLFDEYENFTPAHLLTSPQNAKFYIHLKEGEYKTWKTYGEWRGEIPNKVFDDGKCYYDYWKEWLFSGYKDSSGNAHGLRDLLNINQVETVFFTLQGYFEYDATSFSKMIRQLFYGEYRIPTTPHPLRHIYDTHIRNLGLNLETLKSIAYWMKHDEKEAATNYTHLTKNQKLKHAFMAMKLSDLH